MTDNKKLDHAYSVLVRHNNWRRGDDAHELINPKELGIAIDTAIDVLEGLLITRDGFRPKVVLGRIEA